MRGADAVTQATYVSTPHKALVISSMVSLDIITTGTSAAERHALSKRG